MLVQPQVVLEDVEKLLRNIFADINNVKNLWFKLSKFLDYKKKWKFYYAWYCLYILNKKVKLVILEKFSGTNVNENDIFSEDLQNESIEDDVISVGSIVKPDDLDKINIKKIEMAFDKKSCVF